VKLDNLTVRLHVVSSYPRKEAKKSGVPNHTKIDLESRNRGVARGLSPDVNQSKIISDSGTISTGNIFLRSELLRRVRNK